MSSGDTPRDNLGPALRRSSSLWVPLHNEWFGSFARHRRRLAAMGESREERPAPARSVGVGRGFGPQAARAITRILTLCAPCDRWSVSQPPSGSRLLQLVGIGSWPRKEAADIGRMAPSLLSARQWKAGRVHRCRNGFRCCDLPPSSSSTDSGELSLAPAGRTRAGPDEETTL